jgi:hypothetical protein
MAIALIGWIISISRRCFNTAKLQRREKSSTMLPWRFESPTIDRNRWVSQARPNVTLSHRLSRIACMVAQATASPRRRSRLEAHSIFQSSALSLEHAPDVRQGGAGRCRAGVFPCARQDWFHARRWLATARRLAPGPAPRLVRIFTVGVRPPMAEPAQSADVEIRYAGDVIVIEPLSPAGEAWFDRTVPNRRSGAVRVAMRHLDDVLSRVR